MSSLSTVLSIVSLAIVGFAVVMIVLNLLLASRRSWIMGIVRVALTLIAAGVALPLSRVVASALTDTAYNFLVPSLGSDVEKILDSLAAGTEGVRVMVSLIIAPIFFLLIFIILRLFLTIIGAILGGCVPPLRNKSRRGIAMACGAVNGLLMAMIIVAPLCGFLTMGGHVLDKANAAIEDCHSPAVEEMLEEAGTDAEEIKTLSKQLNKQPVIKAVSYTVGRPIFSYLTSDTLDTSETHGEVVKMNLERELTGFACAGIYAVDAADALQKEDFTSEDKTKLYAVADHVLESDWIKLIATDALTGLGNNWSSGEEFAGKGRPATDAMVTPTVDCLLEILSKEDLSTLEDDLHVILDVLGDFLTCDLFSEINDPAQLIKNLSGSDILNTTMDKLNANERLAPIATEIKALSVRLLSNMLGLEDLKNGEHAALMNDVAGQLNDVLDLPEDDRHEAISAALSTAFDDYGYEVPEDVALNMADQMIDELGKDGRIEGDELTDYLVNHAGDSLELLPDGDGTGETLPDIPDIPDIPGLPEGILP